MSLIKPAERTRSFYCVEVDTDAFLKLCKAEHAFHIPYEESLSARLEGITVGACVRPDVEAVHSVEYDPHFGAFIYYGVDIEHDTPELHAKVADIIRDQLKKVCPE